ncbi:MAG TPA: DUF1501 domain-containing protein [Capsulimonadaceae bacterium]|nr:DUF1501 domain-containing protein [Capsulimonadaceae bacterium]
MKTTRRTFLTLSALTALGWANRPKSALAAVSVGVERGGPPGDVLVSIFLRGGADGLNVVVPYADEDYFRFRPTLALRAPKDNGDATDRVIDLDGFFGLHPALAPLLPLYQAGQMAIVHACGSGDQTRSHFEAMATVERGIARETGPASGWLARHLQSAPWQSESPLRAVAIGEIVPQTLSGAPSATTLHTVTDLGLHIPTTVAGSALRQSLSDLYAPARDGKGQGLRASGREALSVLQTLESITPASYRPSYGATYPKDDLGNGLSQVALLMKCGIGLEAACLDHVGYDTHVAQGRGQGLLASQLQSLASGLAAFAADLGPERWARTCVVVLSEFGRRVEENSGGGTDHGRAGVMFVLGGGAAGGKVHGEWPTLAPANLEGPGDLHVTTDYRAVLAEVISKRLRNPNIAAVFPSFTPQPAGVVHG